MHEKDLRRLALESGKTTSRKARARLASGQSSAAGSGPTSRNNSPRISPRLSPAHSPGVSPSGSRSGSRAASRQGSEDEAEFDSDELASSIASIDLSRFHQYDTAAPEVWELELDGCSEQIIERSRNMRNTSAGREEMLAIYVSILQAQYAVEEVSPKVNELVPAFLKLIKSGSTEAEVLLALKALSMTVMTTGDEIFAEVSSAVKGRIHDSSSEAIQSGAIHSLGAVAFFGGADEVEVEETMEFLLHIASSDGESVDAEDSGPVVAAALQEWGFLATLFNAMDGTSDDPMNVFEDQLDSSILSVQTAAGANAALLYEKSWEPLDDDEEGDDIDEDDLDQHEHGNFQRIKWAHRYEANPAGDDVLQSKLRGLATANARYMGKDSKRSMHQTFRDVLHSIQHPWRGPRYSTTIEQDSKLYLGHRLAVRHGRQLLFVINRWWKLHRWEAIKRIAGGGVINHYKLNKLVREALPQTLVAPERF